MEDNIKIDNITEQFINLDEEGHAEIKRSNDISLKSNSFISNLESTKSHIAMEHAFTESSL